MQQTILKKINKKSHRHSYTSLSDTDNDGNNPLLFFLKNFHEFNLTTEEKDFLLHNTNLKQTNRRNLSPIVEAFNQFHYGNSLFTAEQYEYLIKNSDLNSTDHKLNSPLTLYLKKKNSDDSLPENLVDYLIKNTDLKKENIDLRTPLVAFLQNYYCTEKDLNVSLDSLDYMIRNSPLYFNLSGKKETVLNLFLSNNYRIERNLIISEQSLDYLLEKTNIDFINHAQRNSLMIAFEQNKIMNSEQWDYLLKNSNLKIQDIQKITPLIYAILNLHKGLNLSTEQWDYLLKNSDLSSKNEFNYNAYVSLLVISNRIKTYPFSEESLSLLKDSIKYYSLNEIEQFKNAPFYEQLKNEKQKHILEGTISKNNTYKKIKM